MPKFNTDGLKKKLANAAQVKQAIMPQAYDYFLSLTPVKTGNARHNTKLVQNTIEAKYAYAEVLDKGRHMTNKGARGSNQATKGMSKPTVDKFRAWIKQYIRIG